jgi:formate hydrogenlyase subunit 3/multisubunit Na+/H+ antiporter MnhD subunit
MDFIMFSETMLFEALFVLPVIIPIISAIVFFINLAKYRSKNDYNFNAAPGQEKNPSVNKVLMIISAVIAGVFIAIGIGFWIMLRMAVAHM